MSRRQLLPVEDGCAVEIGETGSSKVFVAASYFKKDGRFSMHKLLVQARLANEFGTHTIDVSNTLPKVQTYKYSSLDDLNSDEAALAHAVTDYLIKSLGLKPKDKRAKHNVQFNLILQSRDDPRNIRCVRLICWTEKRMDAFKVDPRKKFKANHFDVYLRALPNKRVLQLTANRSNMDGI